MSWRFHWKIQRVQLSQECQDPQVNLRLRARPFVRIVRCLFGRIPIIPEVWKQVERQKSLQLSQECEDPQVNLRLRARPFARIIRCLFGRLQIILQIWNRPRRGLVISQHLCYFKIILVDKIFLHFTSNFGSDVQRNALFLWSLNEFASVWI